MREFNTMFNHHKSNTKKVNTAQTKEIEDQKKRTIAAASELLSKEEFRMYRKQYIKLREVTLESLVNYVNSDPIAYAFEVQRMLGDARLLGLVLRNITKAAK